MKRLFLFTVLALSIGLVSVLQVESRAAGTTQNETAETATVYQCPMDKYTSREPGKCAVCGMKMEKKTMTAAEAQTAIDKAKDQMRKRS